MKKETMNDKIARIEQKYNIPFSTVVYNTMDIGQRTLKRITEKEISQMKGNGFMTETFVQDLTRASVEFSNWEITDIIKAIKAYWR